MAAVALAELLLALSIGVLPLGWPVQLVLLALLLLSAAVLLRRRRWLLLACLLLPLLCGWGLLGQPHPGPADPVHRIPAAAIQQPVALSARLLEDPRH
ncbi:DUF4131 domain-containing protein, partial [Vulcanococcus sp.]|uniref:DUF4131 domain-containing protein n=1 Tax=Vulcanococcus sp. TaxID=2856995 RepID=UPI003F69F72E